MLVGVSEGLAKHACALCVRNNCLPTNPNEIGFTELNWKFSGISCHNVLCNVITSVHDAKSLTQY